MFFSSSVGDATTSSRLKHISSPKLTKPSKQSTNKRRRCDAACKHDGSSGPGGGRRCRGRCRARRHRLRPAGTAPLHQGTDWAAHQGPQQCQNSKRRVSGDAEGQNGWLQEAAALPEAAARLGEVRPLSEKLLTCGQRHNRRRRAEETTVLSWRHNKEQEPSLATPLNALCLLHFKKAPLLIESVTLRRGAGGCQGTVTHATAPEPNPAPLPLNHAGGWEGSWFRLRRAPLPSLYTGFAHTFRAGYTAGVPLPAALPSPGLGTPIPGIARDQLCTEKL